MENKIWASGIGRVVVDLIKKNPKSLLGGTRPLLITFEAIKKLDENKKEKP
jgi:hypothetical protein